MVIPSKNNNIMNVFDIWRPIRTEQANTTRNLRNILNVYHGKGNHANTNNFISITILLSINYRLHLPHRRYVMSNWYTKLY